MMELKRAQAAARAAAAGGASSYTSASRSLKAGRSPLSYARQTAVGGVLLALVLAVQMLGLPQPVTGPAVNASLLLAVLAVGPAWAAAIGGITPVVALWRGILAAPLGPMVPFIAIGNAVLAAGFAAGRRVHFGVGVLLGSVLKWLVLSAAVQWVVEVPAPVARALQWPQLVTALAGGVLAGVIWAAVRRALGARARA